MTIINNNPISADNQEMYQRMIENLPSDEKYNLEHVYPKNYSETVVDLWVDNWRKSGQDLWKKDKFKDAEFKTSQISLEALRRNKMSWKEVFFIHMQIEAIKNFVVKPRFFSYLEMKQLSVCAVPSNLKENQRHYILKGNYKLEGITNFDEHRVLSHEEFKKKITILYGKKELKPILMKFFAFNKAEWSRFQELMEKEPQYEKEVLIVTLPDLGNYSPIIKKIHNFLRCFQPVKYFFTTTSREINSFDCMVVPSFSALQNFLQVKAELRNRSVIRIIPQFGPCSDKQLESMKRNGEHPMGLAYRASKISPLKKQINQHMKNFDGWLADEFSFSLHDLYHILREMEMNDSISGARFKIIDILRKYLLSHPLEKEKVENLIRSLLDGELLFSYGYEKSVFRCGGENDKFGNLFTRVHTANLFNDDIVNLIISDMEVNRAEWKQQFNLSMDDLLKSQRTNYIMNDLAIALQFLKNMGEDIDRTSLRNIEDLNLEDYAINDQQTLITDCEIKNLTCHSAIFLRCKIDSVQASGNLIFIDCPQLGNIKSDRSIYASRCSKIENYQSKIGKVQFDTQTLMYNLNKDVTQLIVSKHISPLLEIPAWVQQVTLKEGCHIGTLKFINCKDYSHPRKVVVFGDSQLDNVEGGIMEKSGNI